MPNPNATQILDLSSALANASARRMHWFDLTGSHAPYEAMLANAVNYLQTALLAYAMGNTASGDVAWSYGVSKLAAL